MRENKIMIGVKTGEKRRNRREEKEVVVRVKRGGRERKKHEVGIQAEEPGKEIRS